MGNKYVDVVITRETKPVSEKGFGTPLVLLTGVDLDYSVYSEIEEVDTTIVVDTNDYKILQRMFGQQPRAKEIEVIGVNMSVGMESAGDETDTADVPVVDVQDHKKARVVEALNQAIEAGASFYYLVSSDNSDEMIRILSEYISAQDKLYAATIDSIDIATELNGMYDNVFFVAHDSRQSYVAEGLVSTIAPRQIGSYTWTFKNIQGVQAAKFPTTQILEFERANASVYINEAGVLMNSKGVAISGEYIDNVQATHYIKARMTENIFRMLALTEKIPYTDKGIALVVSEIEKVLKHSYNVGIICDDEAGNPEFTITAPKRADILKNTVAKRILPDVRWRAVVAGAVEKVEIRGVLAL